MIMRKSSGQALLVVLLVLSVALTAGLSLVARTTTDISISQKETESNKAFEAAEAGVEEALKKLAEGGEENTIYVPDLGSGASVAVEISDIPVSKPAIRSLRSGEAATFWLNSFNLDGEDFPSGSKFLWSGDLKICWDDSSVNDKVEIIVYYYDSTNYGLDRYYGGGGSSVSCSADSSGDFKWGRKISNLRNKSKFVNVRFYGTGSGAVRFVAENSGGSSLPPQGKVINSQGEVGDVSRRIQVIRTWPELPSFFDFVLFSGGTLNK